MIYRIVHRTTYKYKYPVSVGNHVACLKPRSLPRHRLAQSELQIKPNPATITERVDYFGNHLCFFTMEEPHDELVVEARSEVVMEETAAAWPRQSASLGRGGPQACREDHQSRQRSRPISFDLNLRASGSSRSLPPMR